MICDLATPRGIDHDYNYLTSIERQFDIAERDFSSRGILLYDETQNGAGRRRHPPTKGEVPLENAIKQCRVVVDKAPKGMSRQRLNATRWDKKAKRIVWTVEWVHKNGSKELDQCPDNEPIHIAYDKILTLKKAKEAEGAERPSKKVKMNGEISRPAALTNMPKPPHSSNTTPATEIPTVQPPSTHPEPTTPKQHEQPLPSIDPKQPSIPPLYFYLLLPSTPTSYRVLIPLASSDVLATALTDRLVLEFPTIYALKQPPDKLPTGFMTEEEYMKGMATKGNLERQLDGLLSEASGLEHEDTDTHEKQDVDEGALRDVLEKDLVREVDTG
ncbi:MAG: hypothetical protein Q9219_001811 [cf. Caloplaca sp. 3 TL-2023]